jgi:hypothetical protein
MDEMMLWKRISELEDRIRRLEEIGAHIWEVDGRRDHPYWGDWKTHKVVVKLDGVEQIYCVAADSKRGAVLCYKRKDGRLVGSQTEIRFGKVEIEEKK